VIGSGQLTTRRVEQQFHCSTAKEYHYQEYSAAAQAWEYHPDAQLQCTNQLIERKRSETQNINDCSDDTRTEIERERERERYLVGDSARGTGSFSNLWRTVPLALDIFQTHKLTNARGITSFGFREVARIIAGKEAISCYLQSSGLVVGLVVGW
jgi:hypothetical protein